MRWAAATLLFLLLWAGLPADAATNEIKAAKVKVSGYGILGDRQLKRMLETVEGGKKKPEFYDASFIEDAVLILMSHVNRDGYLKAKITAELSLEGGRKLKPEWDEPIASPLPRTLRAKKVHFKIKEGVLYHFKQLKFEGLESLSEKTAKSFFIEADATLPLKSTRIYTPDRLERGLSSVTDALERKGCQSAQATVKELRLDEKKGAVFAIIQVAEGQKSIVRSVREEVYYGKTGEPAEVETVHPNKPYSRLWEQDFIQRLRTNYYHHGYPDTTVEAQVVRRETADDVIQLDLLTKVETGPEVFLSGVKFEGEENTRESVMKRRVRLQEGSLLDRIAVEQGRYRLSRLGIFDSVELRYEPVDEDSRDVIYQVREGKQTEVSLLLGYGSYELLRGGVEVRQNNIFGRAHSARARLVQSFKSSSGDFKYTMPELIGKDIDVFFNAFGLRREEISFTREEYGGGAGVHKYFQPIASDVSLRYNYQILNAAETSGRFAVEGVTNAALGAVITDLKHDRRDNPLYPRKGYKVFTTLELASEYLAGDVNYARLEVAASFHHRLWGGPWLHLGSSQGYVVTRGSTAEDLPFNKRFFLGGENSIRGFQQGEASPRNTEGKIVGAEAYILGTVELEQSLTPKWSLVFFSDSLGFAHRFQDTPFDESLYSVGGGLRWKTVIGPVRLEYGHNLNPRPKDPAGTLHFSLGFPF